MCSYQLGAGTPDDFLRSPLLGAVFETHVLGQIVRHFANQSGRRGVYFHRDHHGHEVDFLIPSEGYFALISASGPSRLARAGAGSRSSRHWLAPTASSRRPSSRRTVARGELQESSGTVPSRGKRPIGIVRKDDTVVPPSRFWNTPMYFSSSTVAPEASVTV
jgi:hypothetical protein